MDSLKKELDLQDKVLYMKLIKKALGIRECEEFEMALQHKSKLQVYRELKWEVGFEKYLEYVDGAPSRMFLKFHFGTHGLFEDLGRDAKGGVTGVS